MGANKDDTKYLGTLLTIGGVLGGWDWTWRT